MRTIYIAEDNMEALNNLKDRIPDSKFQKYEEVVLKEDWWWAVQICLSVIALLGNFLFIITIIYNR